MDVRKDESVHETLIQGFQKRQDCHLLKRKPLKPNKIRKIVEYFEHTTCSKSPISHSKADTEIDDSGGNVTSTVEEKKVDIKNAFSILMEGAKQDQTPRRGKLKRLGNASIRNPRK